MTLMAVLLTILAIAGQDNTGKTSNSKERGEGDVHL